MNQEFQKLDHNSIIPLYYQLKEIILEKIESGEWGEGQLVASENDLQKAYGVSRATVRRTMELLVNEGFLEKRRGKGTFVKKPIIEEDLPINEPPKGNPLLTLENLVTTPHIGSYTYETVLEMGLTSVENL